MAIIDLTTLLPVAHQNFWLTGDDLAIDGMDGNEVIVGVENRKWVGRIELPALNTADALLARAAGDRIRGRLNQIRLRLSNQGTPNTSAGARPYYKDAARVPEGIAMGFGTFRDGTGYSDGTGYEGDLPDTSQPVTVGAAAVGASTLTVSGDMGLMLQVGAFFSRNDFLYRVASNADGVLTFNPPLRQAIADGVTVIVNNPTILVRLADKDGWRVLQDYCRNGRPMAVDVVEVISHD